MDYSVCKQAVCEIAGFSEAELVDKANNIVRHPGILRIVFIGRFGMINSTRGSG